MAFLEDKNGKILHFISIFITKDMDIETLKLKLPKSERQLWRVYLTDHLGKPPKTYDPSIRIKFTSTKTIYKVLVDGELVAFADYSKGYPILRELK